MVMPNSLDREAFEKAYAAIHPITPTKETAWICWQAGAAAERERKDEKPVCRHVNTQPMWDHMACLDCGSVRPDGNKTGRPNKGWFRSMDSFRNWDRSAP